VILGLGIDLLDNRRVEQELLRGNWLLDDGIFTPEEISYCGSSKKPALRYAACFAAKEATLKALGVRVSDLAMFREVEVGRAINNEYKIVLHSRLKAEAEELGVRRINLALARSAKQTGAVVILEA
jgi:holo-[acyl-carrier protein] synthase